jgi:ABC-2 type transport system ATP-binding protein
MGPWAHEQKNKGRYPVEEVLIGAPFCMEIILETNQLEKQFRNVYAVRGVNLRVQRGEIYGFLGPNGAGKTTTIGMILGLIAPSAGQIRLFGEPVSPRDGAPLRKVGALVGNPALEPNMTARENLHLAARLRPNLPLRRVDEALEWTGLQAKTGRSGPADDRPVRAFSTGMKQRLGLAMALLDRPELLILDEPTNGMDPAGMREIRLLLTGLAAQGMTIFLSSHLLHEVEQTCTRVAVLHRGQIVAEGPVSELLRGKEAGQPGLRIRVDLPERAAALLANLPGARNLRTERGTVTVNGISGQQAIRCLVASDLVPEEVVQVQPGLEALFLELTGEDTPPQTTPPNA